MRCKAVNGLGRIPKTGASAKQGFKGYPLYPYLAFRRLARNLNSADPEDVNRFLADHTDMPLADRLRRSWLKRLAAQGHWE